MNLWYITVLVITTLSPPEGYMQYTQGFKDEASCQAFLNKPGVKEQVEADIKWQTQKVLIELILHKDKKIRKIENKISANRENCCLLLFLRNADLMAIIKSSLPDAIYLNTL